MVPGRHEGSTHLLDSNADSDGVDGSLNQNFLLVVAADNHRLEEQLSTAPKNKKSNNPKFLNLSRTCRAPLRRWRSPDSPNLHLWLVVSLHHLGGEILQAEGRLQGRSHRIEIWA